jgi:ACS family hexuronate transporter-like MFS transporter
MPAGSGKMTDAAQNAVAEPPSLGVPAISRVRWGVLLLLFFAAIINFIDRQVIGLVKQPVSADLGWTERDYANVVSAFLLAYAIGLATMGRLTDRLGVKRGLSVAVVVWSIAACAQGLVHSTLGFVLCRFGLGVGEGGNFPTAVKATGLWFPPRERALAVGLLNTGTSVGAMVAPLFVPWITLTFGWPAAFFVTGSLGFIWLSVWWLRYHEPPGHPRLSSRERALLGSSGSPQGEFPFAEIFRWRGTWAFVAAAALTLPIWFFYLFWVPDFFQRNLGLSLREIGLPLMCVYLLSDVGSIAGGAFSSMLVRRGLAATKARKLAMLASALLAIPVVLAPGLSKVWVVTLIIGCAAAAHQSYAANVWTLLTETVPAGAVASVFGFGAMVGSLGSIGMAQVTGAVLHATGSYAVLFWAVPALYLLALGVVQVLLPQDAAAV